MQRLFCMGLLYGFAVWVCVLVCGIALLNRSVVFVTAGSVLSVARVEFLSKCFPLCCVAQRAGVYFYDYNIFRS